MEIWKSFKLDDCEVQFYASSLGRIKSDPYSLTTPSGKDGKSLITRTFAVRPTYGYANRNRVEFSFRKKKYKLHRLVCVAFNGPPPFEGAIVLHLDEDYTNNRPTNLKWGTHRENALAPSLVEWNAHKERHRGQFKSGIKKYA